MRAIEERQFALLFSHLLHSNIGSKDGRLMCSDMQSRPTVF